MSCKSIIFLFFILTLAVAGNAQDGNKTQVKPLYQFLHIQNDLKNGFVNQSFTKENTQGSPYLLAHWAKGQITLNNNEVAGDSGKVLNYDKLKHALVLKVEEKGALLVNMQPIKSFTLEDTSVTYNFVKVPEISGDYVMQLYGNSGYALYKLVKTKFYKSDYENAGLYEKGYKYDRYEDEATYFIKDGTGKYINLHSAGKSDLKRLAASVPEVNKFLQQQKIPEDMDQYLVKLVSFLAENEK